MFYPVLATASQFKWFADQLKASRAIVAESQRISQSLFGNKLANFARIPAGDRISSAVNIGMSGFPLVTLNTPLWAAQFQYRCTSPKGLPQYDNGDLYLSQMGREGRLVCDGLPMLGDYPISSAIFRLDLEDRARPRWLVEPHQNIRPVITEEIKRAKRAQRAARYAKAL